MVRLSLPVMALSLGLVFVPGVAAGQTHAEVRGAYTIGSHTATAAGMEKAPAVSFEVLVIRQVTPLFSVYGGYARTAFGCEEGFCVDLSPTITGNHGVLGAQAHKAWAWARVGVLFGKTEVGSGGESPDMGPGLHVGVGGLVGTGRLQLTPGVSFRYLSASTPSSSDHAVALGLDLGVRVRLGGPEI